MRTHRSLAASGLVLSLFLAAPVLAKQNSFPTPSGERVGADGMPTTHSTPAEKRETATLNNQVQDTHAAIDALAAQGQAADDAQIAANSEQQAANDAQSTANQTQYDQQKQQYQQQLQENQAAQQNYEDRTRAYYSLRDRYAAERAAYHRAVWPTRFSSWRLENDARLIGSRVEIINGDRVGTVDSVARAPSGRIEALYVTLDGGKQVWIDEGDIRFDRADGVVMTNLARADLRVMADERM
jgi:hypothetical protein